MSGARGSPHRSATARSHAPLDLYGESLINMALVDHRRFGWTASGGVADLLPPHERARRKSCKKTFARKRKRNQSMEISQMSSEGDDGVSRSTSRKATLAGSGKKDAVRSGANGVHTTQIIVESTTQQPLHVQDAATVGASLASDSAAAAETVQANDRKERPISSASDPASTMQPQALPPSQAGRGSAGGGDWYHDCTIEELRKLEPLHFRALTGDGTLDIYTYRHGREECEIRDGSGELLCDTVSPADATTFGGTDPPRTVVSVTVEFPLEDELSSGERAGPRHFKEVVDWDLANPQCPTPMKYAADIALEFGLSYTQTLDLAESIQNQIRQFVNEHVSAGPALATKRRAAACDRASRLVPTLYGEAAGDAQGGILYTAQHRTKSSSARHSRVMRAAVTSSAGRKPSNGAASSVGKASGPTRSGKRPAKTKRSDARPLDAEKPESVYRDEVQRRLRVASSLEIQTKLRQAAVLTNGSFTVKLTVHDDELCHRCHTMGRCVAFACGMASHTYCMKHISEQCDQSRETDDSTMAWILEFCPICALHCDCRQCQGKLDVVAIAFREKHVAQCVSVTDTAFGDLYEFSKLAKRRPVRTVDKDGSKPKASVRRRSVNAERPTVVKVPESEFPREIYQGRDLDPGTPLDYATLYTKKGTLVRSDVLERRLPVTPAVDSGEGDGPGLPDGAAPQVLEDGSVDYCNICDKVGDLLCCDCCPRAFHSACLGDDVDSQIQSDARWECPSCLREKNDLLPEDQIDGGKSLTAICVAFDDICRPLSDDNLRALKTLSVIHEMLLALMEYDFGYIFREPVDCNEIPSYRSIITEPMDLGTIASNLIGGVYRDKYCTKGAGLEDAVLAVLKDVELVWNNCFLFNCEGSAVYRMAEVLKRRAASICRHSLDPLLSNRVKDELGAYVRLCEASRASRARRTPSGKDETPTTRGQAKHKITAAGAGVLGRPVAAFDPDTGRVVKAYSSMLSVVSVLNMFFNHKFACEWAQSDVDKMGKVRGLVMRSSADPNLLIFGYRWLFLDDLRDGIVIFRENDGTTDVAGGIDTSNRGVEVQEEGRTYVFGSAEEALSYFESNVSELAECADKAQTMGLDEIVVAGRHWRFLDLADAGTELALSSSGIDISKIPGVVAVKEDSVSKRKLMAFRSFEAAYEDFCRTLMSSVLDTNVTQSMEVFQSFYLKGGKDVDGIIWKAQGDHPSVTTQTLIQRPADSEHIVQPEPPAPVPILNGILAHKDDGTNGLERQSNTASTGTNAKLETMALANGIASPFVHEQEKS